MTQYYQCDSCGERMENKEGVETDESYLKFHRMKGEIHEFGYSKSIVTRPFVQAHYCTKCTSSVFKILGSGKIKQIAETLEKNMFTFQEVEA